MHATYETIQNRPTLRFERQFAHPIERVWQAITDPAELAQWFPSRVELELRRGGPMAFIFEHDLSDYADVPEGTHTMTGEITDLEPPELFAFYWGGDRLIFELEPLEEGAACRLRFTVILDAPDKAARDAAGWHLCLDSLERSLAAQGRERSGATDDWRTHYDEYERRGFPVGAPLPD